MSVILSRPQRKIILENCSDGVNDCSDSASACQNVGKHLAAVAAIFNLNTGS